MVNFWCKVTHFLIKSNKMAQNKDNAIENPLWMVVKIDNRDFYTHLTNTFLPVHRWQSITRIIHFAAHSGKYLYLTRGQ